MSTVTSTLVQALAESLQYGALSKDAAEGLAPHLEVRLREIIQDALKLMRRSKRHTLSSDDINSALIARNKEVSSTHISFVLSRDVSWCIMLPRFQPSTSLVRMPTPSPGSKCECTMVFCAELHLLCCLQPVYGYGGRTVARFANPEGMTDCFYIPDPYVDLKDVRHTATIQAPLTLRAMLQCYEPTECINREHRKSTWSAGAGEKAMQMSSGSRDVPTLAHHQWQAASHPGERDRQPQTASCQAQEGCARSEAR